MQWGVGQEDTQVGITGCDSRRHGRVLATMEQDDRALGAGEELSLAPAYPGHPAGRLQVRDHHRERLLHPVLTVAQLLHGGRPGGIAGQVKSAQALDGHDFPGRQGVLGCRQGGVSGRHGPARRTLEPDVRSARRAGDGLGVEAPVGRILVLAPAVGAEREAGHGRLRAVVGQANSDGEPGAAVGAVGEGIAVAAVGRVEQLGQAVIAHGHVRRHERRGPALVLAFDDTKPGVANDRDLGRLDVEHPRQRRSLPDQPGVKPGDLEGAALDLDEYAVGVVADVSGEEQFVGQAMHKRTEPNPLYHTRDPDPVPDRPLRRRRGDHPVRTCFLPRVTAASRCIRPKL